ncbi:unnamed protein product [Scytosiphon promiscuus]
MTILPLRSKIVGLLGTVGFTALLAYVTTPFWVKEKQHCSPEAEAYYNHRLLRQQDEWSRETTRPGNASASGAAPGVVEKRVFSSEARMVFLVGLEGTGHHFMNHVLDHVCSLDEVRCPGTCSLGKAIHFQLSTPMTAADYQRGLEALRNAAEDLARVAEGQDGGTVTLLYPGQCASEVGQLSFPYDGGKDKALQYVDVKVLAEEAERAGIDLRFVYLSRLARSLLLSDTQKRHFGGGFVHEARILTNNAAVIDSSLRELDPNFVTCFSYETSCDPVQASRLADFISPTESVAKKVATILLETVSVDSPASREDQGEDAVGWEMMARRLQGKLDDIERDWC